MAIVYYSYYHYCQKTNCVFSTMRLVFTHVAQGDLYPVLSSFVQYITNIKSQQLTPLKSPTYRLPPPIGTGVPNDKTLAVVLPPFRSLSLSSSSESSPSPRFPT